MQTGRGRDLASFSTLATEQSGRSQLRQKAGEQGRPLDEPGNADVFVLGMAAVARATEPVDGRYAQRCGEVAVAGSAGAPLLQVEPEGSADLSRALECGDDCGGPLHRRPVKAAFDRDARPGMTRA